MKSGIIAILISFVIIVVLLGSMYGWMFAFERSDFKNQKIEIEETYHLIVSNQTVSATIQDNQKNVSYEQWFSESDLKLISKTLYGEARGSSRIEQMAVVWTILNRVDSAEYPGTISEVILQESQFTGYNPEHPNEGILYDLAKFVCIEWVNEKNGFEAFRILDSEYLYFYGDGTFNYFYKTPENREIIYFEKEDN